jgi:hypothetical protein
MQASLAYLFQHLANTTRLRFKSTYKGTVARNGAVFNLRFENCDLSRENLIKLGCYLNQNSTPSSKSFCARPLAGTSILRPLFLSNTNPSFPSSGKCYSFLPCIAFNFIQQRLPVEYSCKVSLRTDAILSVEPVYCSLENIPSGVKLVCVLGRVLHGLWSIT